MNEDKLWVKHLLVLTILLESEEPLWLREIAHAIERRTGRPFDKGNLKRTITAMLTHKLIRIKEVAGAYGRADAPKYTITKRGYELLLNATSTLMITHELPRYVEQPQTQETDEI